ncbi:DUF3237 domain-containing protein [Frankia sp. QA3]|uniref:DUF3237 domain-containing protein n=1 Tax=Frankia sp. QA3 TaxID=710111 RepID=UPI0002DE91DB|nr:DUF3237 domain-containing protein [Frankia sp. QA3]
MEHLALEFVMEVRLRFTRVQTIPTMPTGAGRGAVYVDGGEFEGPRLRGRAVPNSGGDYSLFRPDGVLAFDARYLLEVDDGTLIMLYNRGYLWGRQPETMQRLRGWAFAGGPPVDHAEYYLRAFPTFEVAAGRHDWLMRHVFVGVGERRPDGNVIRYYALL